MDDFDVGKSLLENFLEIGMSTARAAIHLGRAYKNTKYEFIVLRFVAYLFVS